MVISGKKTHIIRVLYILCLTATLFFTLPAYALSTRIEMDVKSGTGFYVTPRHVITNQHVVDGCKNIVVRGAVAPTNAKLLGSDEKMDLALLRTDQAAPRIAYLRSNPGLKAGDTLNIIGYPEEHSKSGIYLLKQAKVVDPGFDFDGIPSILFTDSVEHGNSGGPLLDYAGNVIGVVVAKLHYKRTLGNSVTRSVRGVAIGLPVLKQFLKTYDIFIVENSSYDIFADPRPDERAKEYTVNVLCVKDIRETVR